MARPRSITAEQEDLIRGMAARGETYRAIGEALGISAATVSRVVSPPASREPAMVATSAPPRWPSVAPRPAPRAAPTPPPAPLEEVDAASPEEEPPLIVSEDPRELARQDWLYYERRKPLLRRRAETEFIKGNLKGSSLLEKEARAAEERAIKLRPPSPPDPDTDPTYRAEARKLAQYFEALVVAVERGEALPVRTFEHAQPVAELSR